MEDTQQTVETRLLTIEQVALDQLHPHPRNYRAHPDDELDHLMESISANGVYRNVVVAHDGTILAGHGVVEAARKLGLACIPVYRTEYGPDDARALKLLVSDNEISHLAASDDRALTELLRELNETDDLLGTGYDEMMLANLVMVSRPASEIEDFDAAAQWVGMPEYDDMGPGQIQVTVHFASDVDRDEFARRLDLEPSELSRKKSIWWPDREKDDMRSVRFMDVEDSDDE
jgi:hypothetical protein